MEYNIIVAGVGGQGVVTAGTLISESALSNGLNVVMSEIHGLAQRGGSVNVEIRIGDVKSPIIPLGETDLVIGIEPMEAVRAASSAGKRTKFLINMAPVEPISLSMRGQEYPDLEDLLRDVFETYEVHFIDAIPLALAAGDVRSVSTVMVGAALQLGVIPIDRESVEAALRKRFSGKVQEINMRAMESGLGIPLLDLQKL